MAELTCEVCRTRTAVGVCCGASGPVSYAICRECLDLGAEPYGYFLAYIACAGITCREEMRPNYYPTLEATVARAGKTEEQFWSEAKAMMEDYCANG